MATAELSQYNSKRRVLSSYAAKLFRPFRTKSQSVETGAAEIEPDYVALAALRRQVGAVDLAGLKSDRSVSAVSFKALTAASPSQGPLQKQAERQRRQFARLMPQDALQGPHQVPDNEPTPIFDSVGKEDLGVGLVDSQHETTPIHDELLDEPAYQPRHRA
jgi:hypothetical protein